MSHSLNRIWVHVVFSTQDWQKLITPSVEQKLHQQIKFLVHEQGCYLKNINGMEDHIHILFLLNQNKSIAEVIKNIKGNSSHWVNHQNLTKNKFAWQTGYGVFSVSESQVKRVGSYISNQKTHHKKMTFAEEFEKFTTAHGFIRGIDGKIIPSDNHQPTNSIVG